MFSETRTHVRAHTHTQQPPSLPPVLSEWCWAIRSWVPGGGRARSRALTAWGGAVPVVRGLCPRLFIASDVSSSVLLLSVPVSVLLRTFPCLWDYFITSYLAAARDCNFATSIKLLFVRKIVCDAWKVTFRSDYTVFQRPLRKRVWRLRVKSCGAEQSVSAVSNPPGTGGSVDESRLAWKDPGGRWNWVWIKVELLSALARELREPLTWMSPGFLVQTHLQCRRRMFL